MTIKEQLHAHCIQQVQQHIQEIEAAIADRREAMHNETKSSMGDKYETTREMLQQDINMNMQRLSRAKTDLAALESIDPKEAIQATGQGSLVITEQANYYIAVSIGTVTLSGKKYYVVSANAPVALQLKGKRAGDEFTINGKAIRLLEVL